ncbi:non-ribosomal peptide synthetase [Paenibacillus sp. T2-29]|uniref:non-ribosomal peptide synthetase n=1 Tax=Paenibacillus TaxID=44249 RepID=UPI0039BCA982
MIDNMKNSSLWIKFMDKNHQMKSFLPANFDNNFRTRNIQTINLLEPNQLFSETLLLSIFGLAFSYFSENDNIWFLSNMSNQKVFFPIKISKNINFDVNLNKYLDVIGKSIIDNHTSAISISNLCEAIQVTDNSLLLINEANFTLEEIDQLTNKFNFIIDNKSKNEPTRLIFNSNVYDLGLINNFIESFTTLFENICTLSFTDLLSTKLKDLDFCSKRQKNKVLFDYNYSYTNRDINTNIANLFEKQVKKNGNRMCIYDGEKSISYIDLNNQSNKLARYIVRLSLNNKFIAVYMERSINCILSILAIIKSGGSYIPLEPEYSNSRLEYMLDDIKPEVIITSSKYKKKLYEKGLEKNIICIDSFWEEITIEDNSNLSLKIAHNDIAYINYTSGSTGNPKGVMIPHKGVIRLVIDPNYIDINKEDCFLHASPLSFDAATFEIWGALLNGSAIAIVDKNTLLSSKLIEQQITKYKINNVFFTTAFFNKLVDNNPVIFSSLKNVIVGGDIVSVKHFKRVIEKYKNTNFIHAYGPTENTTFSTYYHIQHLSSDAKTIPIGKPINGSNVYILKNGKIVPPGVIGEIYVGGQGLAKGYLNQQEKTDEVFRKIALDYRVEASVYKTGDLGRWLLDGNIEFYGRIDKQIKIRGFRIEPGEIEHILMKFEGVKETTVIAYKEKNDDKGLIVFFTATKVIDPNLIRNYLQERLPYQIIPSAFIQIESIPLTDNAKIDEKKLLKEYQIQKFKETIEFDNITNLVCSKIKKIWCELLKIENVSIDSNFFEVGGNSLLLMDLHSHLHSQFNCEISIADLFQYPTIKQLSSYMESEKQNAHLKNKILSRASRIIQKN